jgi:putative transposase
VVGLVFSSALLKFASVALFFTTNAIESLNSVIRKAINNRKFFSSDQSALKVIYLAIQNASKKWTMSLHDWRAAMNRFAIEFEDRMPL